MAGIAVETGRNLIEHFVHIADLDIYRAFRHLVQILGMHDAHRACLDRICSEGVAVIDHPLQAEVHISRLHFARIDGQTADLDGRH